MINETTLRKMRSKEDTIRKLEFQNENQRELIIEMRKDVVNLRKHLKTVSSELREKAGMMIRINHNRDVLAKNNTQLQKKLSAAEKELQKAKNIIEINKVTLSMPDRTFIVKLRQQIKDLADENQRLVRDLNGAFDETEKLDHHRRRLRPHNWQEKTW